MNNDLAGKPGGIIAVRIIQTKYLRRQIQQIRRVQRFVVKSCKINSAAQQRQGNHERNAEQSLIGGCRPNPAFAWLRYHFVQGLLEQTVDANHIR